MTVVAQDISTLAGARTLPFLAGVEERLAAQLADDLVGRASRETLAAGGKRLRPLLVLISAPPDARERPELEIAACAAELVHMATLVHDDVLDAAPLAPRVTRPSGRATARRSRARPATTSSRSRSPG